MKEGGPWPPFFSQIRKHQYCVAKKGEMDDNTKIWRLECQANWTRRGDGRERSYWVIETSVIFLAKRLHHCFSYLKELKAAIRINTQIFRWWSSLLLNDFQDSYVMSCDFILRSVQVNGSAIHIQPGVVKNILCRPYQYHCESLIVRIIFSHLFFASEDHS